MYTILLAEPDTRICRIVRSWFEKDGATITTANDGNELLMKALNNKFDLVIMNPDLPSGLRGTDVCHLLKGVQQTPVIFLTEKSSERDRLNAFEAGVDDYVIKPFSLRELVCRVRAILRRVAPTRFGSILHMIPSNNETDPTQNDGKYPTDGPRSITFYSSGTDVASPKLTINPSSRTVYTGGKEIHLTRKEYEILHNFALHHPRTLSREDLLQAIWQLKRRPEPRIVDTHIKRLREKLNDASPTSASLIRTVRGEGYKLNIP